MPHLTPYQYQRADGIVVTLPRARQESPDTVAHRARERGRAHALAGAVAALRGAGLTAEEVVELTDCALTGRRHPHLR
jgi:hypothetical protein